MLEAKLRTTVLKKIVEYIKDLVTEATFHCGNAGINIQAMDSSHVFLVSLKMEVGLFETFHCDRNREVRLKVTDLAKALKYANNEDTSCTITVDDDENAVTFAFSGMNAAKTQRVTLKMVEINEDVFEIPTLESLDYQVVCKMPLGEFAETCTQLTQFTDNLSVCVTKDGIVFTGKGEAGSWVVAYSSETDGEEKNGKVHVVLNAVLPVNVNFSLQYLNSFNKAVSMSNFVTISLSEHAHALGAFEYQIEEHGSLCFYLAPKIEDDDEDKHIDVRGFEAKLKTAILKKIVESIKDLGTEATFRCCNAGINVQALDSSNVFLVSLKMEVDLFEAFHCDRNREVGLKITDLTKALKYANNEDSCTITVDDDENTVTFVFRNKDAVETQRVTLNMVECHEAFQISTLDYMAVCKMPSGEFKKTCTQLTKFTDNLSVCVTKGGIMFTGKGENGARMITYSSETDGEEENEKVHVVLNGVLPVNVNFSLQYINSFNKAVSMSNFVTISLSEDAPGAFEYEIEEHGSLCFYLAPRIDDDDEDM